MVCPYDGAPARLIDSIKIYKTRSYGLAWVCSNYPRCDAYVGCYGNSEKPLGRLADAYLRRAKKKAHAVFDPLWAAKMKRDGCSKGKARGAGYYWLSQKLGIPFDLCHIGMFDIKTCLKVVQFCATYSRSAR